MVFATNKYIVWKIRCDGYVKFNKLSKKQLNDPEIAKEVLKIDGSMLSKMNEENRDNERLVEIAVSDYLHPNVFGYASDRLKNDKEFIKDIIRKNMVAYYVTYMSDELQDDKDFIIELINILPSVYKQAKWKFRSDKQLTLDVIPSAHLNITDIPLDIRSDRDILISFVKNNQRGILSLDKEYLYDKELVRIALSADDYDTHHIYDKLPLDVASDDDLISYLYGKCPKFTSTNERFREIVKRKEFNKSSKAEVEMVKIREKLEQIEQQLLEIKNGSSRTRKQ